MQTTYPWNTIGHQHQLLSLEQEVKQGKIAHAYLFMGPPQTGKHRIAKTWAQILQCRQDFCRSCEDCRQIEKRCHPDVIWMDDNGESIGIDPVRDIIQKTHLSIHGKYRIVVIENMERMPIEAQNSFLKILEEPPTRTLFLLTASETDQVLPTIQSRTRNYYFFSLHNDVIRAYLKERFGPRDDLEDIVVLAQGRPGMAVRLAESPALLEEQRQLYHRVETILSRNDLADKILYVEAIDKDDQRVNEFIDAFTRYLRKLMYDYLERPEQHPLRSRFGLHQVVNLFESLQKTRYLMDRNVNRRLVLENLMLKTEIV